MHKPYNHRVHNVIGERRALGLEAEGWSRYVANYFFNNGHPSKERVTHTTHQMVLRLEGDNRVCRKNSLALPPVTSKHT